MGFELHALRRNIWKASIRQPRLDSAPPTRSTLELLPGVLLACAVAILAPAGDGAFAVETPQPPALGTWVHDDDLNDAPGIEPALDAPALDDEQDEQDAQPEKDQRDEQLEPLDTPQDESGSEAPGVAAPIEAPAAGAGAHAAASSPVPGNTALGDPARNAPALDAPVPANAMQAAPSSERTPQPASSPAEPIAVSHDARGKVITVHAALFAHGSAAAEPAAAPLINELVAMLALYPGRSVLIESHTDDAGPAPANLQTSSARAAALRAAFAARGIAPEAVEARGYGEAYPVATNANDAGRRVNDRIEIIVRHAREQDRYRESYEASVGDLTPY